MMVQFSSNGDHFDGYLAIGPSGGPGVILLQEWWGLVGHIKEVADRLAAVGFTVLAPDLYRGKSTDEPDEAGSLMMALNIAETGKVLDSAVSYLLSLESCSSKKIGVVGFCMGGQLAMFAACENPEIGVCVNYYGVHPNVQPQFANLNAPIFGFFAEHDDYASAAAVENLTKQLEEAGKSFAFMTYPGTHHAFFNDARPEVYNAEAAGDSWKRMINAFDTHLK